MVSAMRKLVLFDEATVKAGDTFTRSRAKGYKSLHINEDVGVLDNIEVVTGDDEEPGLTIQRTGVNEGLPDAYVIICKEFGLAGIDEGFTSKVSVVFLDKGYMMVTLYEGACVLYLDNELLMPSIGDVETPNVTEGSILWVNQDFLLSYTKYLEPVKKNLLHDFELMLQLKGGISNGMSSSSVKFISSEDKDISLGHALAFERKLNAVKDMKALHDAGIDFSSSGVPAGKEAAVTNEGVSSGGLVFDGDDEDDEEDAFEDDDY